MQEESRKLDTYRLRYRQTERYRQIENVKERFKGKMKELRKETVARVI